ncbi:MAG: cell division protein SepF [Candidatus Methanodesulfokora washburnensis]|jgi:SepF-like predicted cell division protein (DUF552 family)
MSRIFKKILGKEEEKEEEEIIEEEKPLSHFPSVSEKAMAIKPMSMRSMDDIDSIVNEVNDGNIVILRYDDMASEPEKLKMALERLKERILDIGGDMVLVKSGKNSPLLIAPRFVEIWRTPKEE